MWDKIIHLLLSFIVFYSIAIILSENKRKISKHVIIRGIALQLIFAILLIKIPALTILFEYFSLIIKSIGNATVKATEFVFGNLANTSENGVGFILAIQGFPILIVIGALSSLLTYWKILPAIIKILSTIFKKIFNVGGTLGIGISVNLFAGMAETPLIIRSYLKHLTHSEIFSLMVCGTSGVSSSIMVIYALILTPVMANPLIHIITAALISIPGALTLSRVVIPETEKKFTENNDIDFSQAKSTIDAIYTGIIDGSKVMIKIIVMIIGFIALINIVNQLLALLTPSFLPIFTLENLLGLLMAPVAWIIGIPWNEAQIVGSLLGTKFVLNEIIAFNALAETSQNLSAHSQLIAVYSLASFANLGSIGVMLGVYTTLVPERQKEALKLTPKAVIIGSIVNYLTAAIANFII